ncbi:MAG: hypothetical protein ACI9IZ_000944, partial [Nonlabens sp.]
YFYLYINQVRIAGLFIDHLIYNTYYNLYLFDLVSIISKIK